MLIHKDAFLNLEFENANLFLQPLTWLQRFHNVTNLARYNEGGHFPAESVPHLVVKEIRAVHAS